ncbi:hypothetical protein K1X84_15095 [bacterium]|nr:hypothetical protein [bacterium]
MPSKNHQSIFGKMLDNPEKKQVFENISKSLNEAHKKLESDRKRTGAYIEEQRLLRAKKAKV